MAIPMRLNTRRRTAVATARGLPRYASNDKVGTHAPMENWCRGMPTSLCVNAHLLRYNRFHDACLAYRFTETVRQIVDAGGNHAGLDH